MRPRQRLKDALHRSARNVEMQGRYAKNPEMAKMNRAALELFGSADPIYRPTAPGERPRNITFLALWRVDRYCRIKGINWRFLDWDSLIEWFVENWEQILKVLLTLLPLIFLI